MVLDGAEENQRASLRAAWEAKGDHRGVPLWAREREWGNDGLVTVQSAKWGEFLGILEGCDRESKSPKCCLNDGLTDPCVRLGDERCSGDRVRCGFACAPSHRARGQHRGPS